MCLFLLFLLGLALPASAATPAFDAASNSGVKNNVSSTSGYSHVAGTLTNGIAVCGVTFQDGTGTVSSVTYGGAAMTLIGNVEEINGAPGNFLAIYYKLAPLLGLRRWWSRLANR
jgi:hypothetical protein